MRGGEGGFELERRAGPRLGPVDEPPVDAERERARTREQRRRRHLVERLGFVEVGGDLFGSVPDL
jgi:hypothetical protein